MIVSPDERHEFWVPQDGHCYCCGEVILPDHLAVFWSGYSGSILLHGDCARNLGTHLIAEIRFLCPIHADSKPSARWNPQKETWYCDPCHVGGGAQDLAQRLDLNGYT